MATAAAILIAGAGVGIVYAGITDQNPLTELRKALASGEVDGRPPPASSSSFGSAPLNALRSIANAATAAITGAGSGTASAASSTPDAAGEWPDDPRNLVAIGQGGHKLEPRAAAAFARWETIYGRKIIVTDSYRSFAQQKRDYAKDPKRFARPESSAHVEGRAVDVNLGALGIGSTIDNAGYAALFRAAQAAGWCGYHGGKPGTETWHFSFAVCK